MTLAIIWLEIVRKRSGELFHKISRSSLPLKTDAVNIIFQHRLRLGSLYFFIKKVCKFDTLIFHLDFCTKFTVVLCLLAYNSGSKTHMANCQRTIMHLPFVNVGAKSQL